MELGKRLYAEDRFFTARRAVLSGPFDVVGSWAAPRVAVSAGAVPFRPSHGVYAIVGPPSTAQPWSMCPAWPAPGSSPTRARR